MTETGASLPEAILRRIEGEKEEAYRSEIRDIEARISEGIDSLLEERKQFLESRKAEASSALSAAAEKGLAELQKFEAETLATLASEADRRRAERLKAQEEERKARIVREEEEAKRAATDEEEKRKQVAAAQSNPAVRIPILLKQIRGHMDRGDLDMASRALAEALELDAFNAELIDLDAKIREARESEPFATPVDTPSPGKKAGKKKDRKGDKQEKDEPKGGTRKVDAPAPEAAAGTAPTVRKQFPSWILSAVAALLIAVVAVIVYVEYAPRHMSDSMTVAILPWSEPGDRPMTKIFADALPEIVLKLLSRDSAPIDLLGYATTFNLSGLAKDPVRSLTGLGYSHFLRGSIGGTDSAYTVHVELTDSAGTTLWSDDFTRDAAGIVLLPVEIAHGLNRYFGVDASDRAGVIEMKNNEAYILYLAGLAATHTTGGSGLDDAINSFSRSLALDSTLAVSHAGLASALVDKYSVTSDADASLLDLAATEATRAISISPTMSDGYLAMARIFIEKHRYGDALTMLDSVSVLAPRDYRVLYLRGLSFFRSGRLEQALDLLRKAYRLDPRNLEILGQLAILHQVQRSFDRALWYRETAMFFSADSSADLIGPISDILALDPALRLTQGGRVTSACLRLLERDPQDYPTLYSLARLLQVDGDIQESNKYLRSLETILRGMVRSRTADTQAKMYLALTLTRLGRYEEGLALAEATAAASPRDVAAKYYLARVYSLQMNAPPEGTAEEARETKTINLLREALSLRFENSQLGSADFYKVYSQADIRSALTGGGQ